MNDTMIKGVLRHILTTLGGALVAKGFTDAATLEAIVGGIIAVVGLAWSIWAKKRA